MYARGEKKLKRRRRPNLGGAGSKLPQKIFELRVLEMPFPAFPAGHLYRYNVYGKERPVTPSELWNYER